MTESEFYGKRRMFAAKDGTVVVAPVGYPYSHVEWLGHLFGWEAAQEWVKTNVRGYVLNGRLVAYVGEFSHRVNHKDVLAAIAVLEKTDTITEVGFGAIPSGMHPWEPRATDTLEDYREKVKNHVK